MSVNIVTYNAPSIEVDGEDLIVDGQVLPIKQKLIYAGLELNEDPNVFNAGGWVDPNASSNVVVRIQIHTYKKAADGSYGDRWLGGYDYVYRLTANNKSWVDNQTGEVLGTVGEELIDANTQEALYDQAGNLVEPAGKFAGKTIIKENEFFERLRDNVDVNVTNLIRSYMINNKSRIQPPKNFR